MIWASALTGPSGSALRYCRPSSSVSANQSCSIALLNSAAYAWSRSTALGFLARYSDSSRMKARSCLAWISATLAGGSPHRKPATWPPVTNRIGTQRGDCVSHRIGPHRTGVGGIRERADHRASINDSAETSGAASSPRVERAVVGRRSGYVNSVRVGSGPARRAGCTRGCSRGSARSPPGRPIGPARPSVGTGWGRRPGA